MPEPILELRRVLLAADGRLKGQFSDNSILLVNKSGSAFMCLSPDGGTTTRQLSEYALNKHIPQLAVLLEFRNMHVDIPFFCKPLLRCSQGAFSLGYCIAEVWWPRDVAEAKLLELLQTLADGRLALSSEDHMARVVLHVHRRRFAVCYPLLVQVDQASGRHEYLWHNQAFSVQSYPPRWQPAVQLLLEQASQTDSISSDSQAGSSAPQAQPLLQGANHPLHHTGMASGSISSSDRPHLDAQHGQHPGIGTTDADILHQESLPQQRQQLTLHSDSLHQHHNQHSHDQHHDQHDQHQHRNQHDPAQHHNLQDVDQHQNQHSHSQHHTQHDHAHHHNQPSPLSKATPQQPLHKHMSRCPGDKTSTEQARTDGTHTARVLNFSQPCSELPTAMGRDPCGICEGFPEHSWWQEPTLSLLPPDDIITLEWVPQATYQFHPELQEVEVWVHADESCLGSCKQGRYVLHCRGPGSPDRLYEASCVPELVWSSDWGERYGLSQLAAHALKIRSQMSAIQASQTLAAATNNTAAPTRTSLRAASHLDSSFAVLSEDVVEHCTNETGTSLIAYADGRVRAVFADRTILHTNASLSHCRVTLPDGKTLMVSSSSPVGVESYVGAAIRFAEWAFLSRAQRQDIRRAHAAVQAEILNSTRMAQLCEYGMRGTVPKTVVTSCRDDPDRNVYAFSDKLQMPQSRVDHTDRQTAIDQLLKANAELLLRM